MAFRALRCMFVCVFCLHSRAIFGACADAAAAAVIFIGWIFRCDSEMNVCVWMAHGVRENFCSSKNTEIVFRCFHSFHLNPYSFIYLYHWVDRIYSLSAFRGCTRLLAHTPHDCCCVNVVCVIGFYLFIPNAPYLMKLNTHTHTCPLPFPLSLALFLSLSLFPSRTHSLHTISWLSTMFHMSVQLKCALELLSFQKIQYFIELKYTQHQTATITQQQNKNSKHK